MAQGRDEHRMVFDIRGRRGVAIKVVYAILALLMVASLFLVTGALNLGTIFGNGTSSESAVPRLEDQATKIEAKLAKEPQSEDLLASLTRTRLNTATAMVNEGVESQDDLEAVNQQYAQASEDWSDYLGATEKPNAGLAVLVAPALVELAEFALQLSGDTGKALENIEAATEAQQIVVDQRPSVNSLSQLSFYLLFSGEYKAAAEAKEKTVKLASTKFARENYENQYEQTEKTARKFEKQLKLEEASKASEASGEAGKGALEKPSLGGLGGATLGTE